MAINGTAANDFIHRTGDGNTPPVGYNEVTDVTTSADTINGLAGHDIIFGDGGNDTIDGGADNDEIHGGAGADDITGGTGDDTLDGGTGNDDLHGGDGTDTVTYESVSTGVNVSLEDGFAAGGGAVGFDSIDGVENVVGSSGDDFIIGDSGINQLIGGEGDDWLSGGGAADSLIGGGGSDTADYSASSLAVSVSLASGTGSGGDAEGDTLSGVENLVGSAQDDSLTGGAGDNSLDGGDGTDTATYAQSVGASAISTNGFGGWTVAAGGAEGTDTLTDVEIVDGAGAGKVLLVGNGGFATIQAAVDAAVDGDTILVIGGTYDEDVDVDVGVTILGANAGVLGTGDRAAESIINGRVTISTASAVTLDGFEFFVDATTGVSGLTNPSVKIAAGGDHTITNSLFFSDIVGGNTSTGTNAIFAGPLASGSVTISDNYFTGSSTGKYTTASWARGLWTDGGGIDIAVTGNTFQYTRSGMNLVHAGSTFDLSGNHFVSGGTGLSYGDQPVDDATDNVFDDVDAAFNLRNLTDPITVDYSTSGNTAAAGSTFVVLGGQSTDTITGTAGDDLIAGDGRLPHESGYTTIGAADHLIGGGGHDTLYGALGDDTLEGGEGDDTLDGAAGEDTLEGGAGADEMAGGAGADSMAGGGDDDTYVADSSDTITELSGEGTDLVVSNDSITLSENVENLTLVDGDSDTQSFDDMALGPIANGENGWTVLAAGRDQEIVDLGGGDHAFRMSSDPSSPDFAGPYSPGLSVAAGEPATSAGFDGQSIKFAFQAVSATPDGSRLEIDFGNTASTDRNNFMVIESSASTGGIRIAVNEPLLDGNWANNDFSAFTGNRSLVAGVDPTVAHEIELRLTYNDGADNDVIQVYLDGELIGTTTTFENYRDALGGTHAANAEANQTNRVFFRPSASGAPQDGPGGALNQGFLIDDLTTSVYNNASGTGNDDANVITGNGGDNELSGLGGADTLHGNDGNDTISGGADSDTITGGAGDDTIEYTVGDGIDTIDGGTGTDTLAVSGTSGDDTIDVVVDGLGAVIEGLSPANVEVYTLDGLGHASGGDTLDYGATAIAVTVDLGTGSADGFTSVSGIENVRGGSAGDSLTGNGQDNTLTGAAGADSLDGGGGTDTAVYTQAVGHAAVTAAGGGWTVTTGGDEGTDTLTDVEIVDGDGANVLLVGNGGFATIQEAITAAGDGDTILIANGIYNGDFTLKNGVTLIGESEGGVIASGTMITPASLEDATVSKLTVRNVGNGMLLDMTDTTSVTDVVFDQVTLDLTSVFTGAIAIGNGQAVPAIQMHDGDDDGAGLTFRSVTMASNDHDFASATAFALTTVESVGGAKMVLDDVTLSGTASGTPSGLGAQWNMTPGSVGSHAVEIVNSHTIGGGNFYVSGFNSVLIDNNVFDGQGLALNGVKNATVTGNTFQNIGGTITANGEQHRGLVIEDAWGTTGVAHVTVTGNQFINIDAPDGAIAFQRFTDGTPADTATIGRLNDVEITGNTFTGLGVGVAPVFLDGTFFGTGAVLPADFDGEQLIIGTDGADDIVDTSTGDTAIFAGAGNDTIDGGVGADAMVGGAGDDSYTVDNPGDTATENANEGTDSVTSSVDFTLEVNVENLTLAGTATDGTGNASNNIITGNAEANTLDGSGGNDTLHGEASEDTLLGGTGDDTLNGGDDGDTLIGGGNNDTLNGGAGADVMQGGSGNDTYVVDDVADVFTESTNQGTDTVQIIFTHTLSGNFENLTLLGAAAINGTGNTVANTITGNASANTLSGLDGADILVGGGGSDRLDGGTGADAMTGGTGNDTYVVDDVGDGVSDVSGADLVETTLSSYVLGANVEKLTFTGDGGFTGTGNGLNNTIRGGGGADTLDGGALADILIGGDGDDFYFANVTGDSIQELANGGVDTVFSTAASKTLGANVENLVHLGTGGATLTGNDLENVVTGGVGNDTLRGEDGSDTLTGGAGRDTLTGGTGADTYVFGIGDTVVGSLRDKITDFEAGTNATAVDKIDVSALGEFTFIGTATFGGVVSPTTGELRVNASGTLQGDIDGDGVIDFEVQLTAGIAATLDASDFLL